MLLLFIVLDAMTVYHHLYHVTRDVDRDVLTAYC